MSRIKLITFKDDLKERLKDPGFRKAWENTEVEYQIAKKLIETREKRQMSQRDLAKKAKTSQAQISRIETMNGNPSIATLKKISRALDVKLTVDLK